MTGEELKRARIRRQLTQKRLGQMLGYKDLTADTVVQKWEYGERPIPLKHYRKLSKILEVPLEKMIPEE